MRALRAAILLAAAGALASGAEGASRFVPLASADGWSACPDGVRVDSARVVAEDGHGVRFSPAPAAHSCHRGPQPAPRLLALPERFGALTAWTRMVYAAVVGHGVVEIDASDLALPRIVRWLRFGDALGEIHALAAAGRKLYALGDGGLGVFDLTSRPGGPPEVHPEIHGHALCVAGRLLTVASDEGLIQYYDTVEGAQLFEVSANSDFFSPAELTIALGDTVRWTNATGDDHNVFSCTTDQLGCSHRASTESFGSGPAAGLWVYDHTFTSTGTNPYICQPHATFMAGSVTVIGSVGSPPAVPDGSSGAPIRVGKLAADGSTLSVAWDTATCAGAADHEIVYGYAFGLPASTGGGYEIAGARCSIGLASPFSWSSVPTAFPGSTGWLWWLVVATDGAATEGSWGRDASGAERQGPGPGGSSGECGIATKNLSNTCGQ